jgi:hypothetical protein
MADEIIQHEDSLYDYPQIPQNPLVLNSELLDKLISTPYVNDQIKQKFWLIFSNAVKLTNLNETDTRFLLIQYELLELRAIRCLTGKAYTPDIVFLFTMLKSEYYANLRRASNGFERKIQATQINQSQQSIQNIDKVHSSGYLGQVKRAIFGGGE